MARPPMSSVGVRTLGWLRPVTLAIVAVAVPILALLTPLYLFITPAFVRHEYAQAEFPPSLFYDTPERLHLSDTILRYVRGHASLEELALLRTDDGAVALNQREVDHLVDVRVVMDAFFVVHSVAAILAAVALVVLWRIGRERLAGALRSGVWVAGGLIAFVVLASLVDFGEFFTRFHELFFSADSWLFYETDTLIQLYPLRFWMDAVWKIGVVVLMELALIYAGANALGRRWPIEDAHR